jgi:hypothetical protein
MVQDLTKGPRHILSIPLDCEWSAREIESLLRSYGVETWGLMIVGQSILITVRMAQARWAQYLLQREGIPIDYLLSPDRANDRPVGQRRAKQRPSGDALDRVLDGVTDWLRSW